MRRSIIVAAAVLGAAAAGCGGGKIGTELLVTATFDPALKIDQLLVLGQIPGSPPSLAVEPGAIPPSPVPAPGGLLPSGASIAIVFPDHPMPSDFTVIVDGRATGMRVATAHADVSIAAAQTNRLTVALAPIGAACAMAPCAVGDRKCDGTGTAVCLADQVGCGVWSDTRQCPNQGACTAGACTGGCAMGQHRCGATCVSDDDVRTCGVACAPCPTADNASALCMSRQCALACSPGFRVCKGACVPAGDPRCQ